ncbi:hypothetical protein ET495_16665 [Xylanimonas allomyrinae]|uniref:Uncharacterized protein n=1 Tax=Xylanimonas allomyrinae TaxID=2509459 RepID=A0A4V0YEK8_9MICO|nr:hypothetical protein [Xylanimonas allomyrinae]QAY64561.1 hypothetical protein ET495_16665 [Xylanimonas allomyrinae]
MTVTEAAALWLKRVDVGGGRLAGRRPDRSREVNAVSIAEAWLQVAADGAGCSAAKTARSVLSSIMGEAPRDRTVAMSAIRSTRFAKAQAKKATTAKTSAI